MVWNSANNTDSYTLAWNIDGGAYTEIPGLTGTGYLHTGLTNGATYNYKIKAVNNDGESSYSSVVSGVVIGTPLLSSPNNITNAPLNTDIISDVVTASHISSPVSLSVSGAEFRVNGGSWVTSANISYGDQVEYKTTVAQDGERKIVAINFN